MTRIGLIADTHGLLRPEAIAFLRDCALILHAGDIGNPELLVALNALAPVTAVRGNNDKGAWAAALPLSEWLCVEQTWFHLLHDIADLDIDPVAAGVNVVVSGHSHTPASRTLDGVVYINPGSAGPRRFRLPVAVGEVIIDGSEIRARWQALTCPQ